MPTKWYERTGRSWPGRAQGRRFPTVPLVVIFLTLLIVFTHSLWLPYLARVLMVGQEPIGADAILVLEGGNGSRQDRAAALYEAGYAPVIIASGEKPELPGLEHTFAELTAEYLVRQGVPREVILLLQEPSCIYEEAVHSLRLAQEQGFSSLLIVTDDYHTRRARLTFQAVYRDSGIGLTIVGAHPDDFAVDSWWTQESSLARVLGEYEMLLYYLLKGYLF